MSAVSLIYDEGDGGGRRLSAVLCTCYVYARSRDNRARDGRKIAESKMKFYSMPSLPFIQIQLNRRLISFAYFIDLPFSVQCVCGRV